MSKEKQMKKLRNQISAHLQKLDQEFLDLKENFLREDENKFKIEALNFIFGKLILSIININF